MLGWLALKCGFAAPTLPEACAHASLQGTILAFVTEFFADFLATDNTDDLVALLKKARLDERLLEFFPPQQRTLDQFNAHFKVLHRLGLLAQHINLTWSLPPFHTAIHLCMLGHILHMCASRILPHVRRALMC